MDYEKYEQKILEEEPYNATKHFLYNLPEIFYFILKFGFIMVVMYAMTQAMTETLLRELPAFCSLLK